VERGRRGTLGADEEKVALGEARLNRRDVDGLKQLRLQELTDSSDFVSRQRGVRIGEKAVGGEVARIGVHGFPAFHQSKLLEAEVTVDSGKGRAARRQV